MGGRCRGGQPALGRALAGPGAARGRVGTRLALYGGGDEAIGGGRVAPTSDGGLATARPGLRLLLVCGELALRSHSRKHAAELLALLGACLIAIGSRAAGCGEGDSRNTAGAHDLLRAMSDHLHLAIDLDGDDGHEREKEGKNHHSAKSRDRRYCMCRCGTCAQGKTAREGSEDWWSGQASRMVRSTALLDTSCSP